ncbi:enoyl-CoA hydratase/isomerase family protein [Oesophagostomum dentatum]|uniref:39S ribosomal protein L46, mitochondrial n=1 Tax=Oesophagostomum dentatum TaxID=61180 RepID=A0A0B1TN41_OESDE|nr:enoyl-CoA hydratase/isomerase family protein [Oesophagostomum dentatum]
MQSDPFVMERLTGKDDGIVLFRMNRPETKNAISTLFLEKLRESIASVKFDKNVRVVVLKSDVEGAFCTGADLKERKSMPIEKVPIFVDSLRASFSELENLPQPVIAAIDGYALGGGLEMALACDIRVASVDSKIGLTETKLAIIPGAGGTQRLTRAVGPSMAKELIFTGRMISGEEASRIGLVNHCTTSDAYSKALEIAREIVPRGPVAVRLAKIAVDAGSEVSLSNGLVVEQQCYAQVRDPYKRPFGRFTSFCGEAASFLQGRIRVLVAEMRLTVLLRSKWDLMVSVALSRPQIIAPSMTEVEKRFQNLQLDEEREKSLLCDFELKSLRDEKLIAKRAELEREGKELSELDEQIGVANAQIEDEWSKRGEQLTQNLGLDKSSSSSDTDEHNLRRMLDRKLLLVVRQRLGQANYESPWILPQTRHQPGESLRETAERCLREIGSGLKASVYGNAPFAVYTQKYPKPLKTRLEKDGAKIFFYHAVISPSSSFTPAKKEVVDYKWVVREEFWSTVARSKYKSCLNSVFLE